MQHKLWKHPNGVWYVLYGPRLKRQLSLKTKDEREAEIGLARFLAVADEPDVKIPAVGRILAGYRDEHGPEVRSPDAIKFAVAALDRHLGTLLPAHLTPTTIKGYARKREAEGVSAGTILRETGTLRAALSWAVDHGWISAALKPSIPEPVKKPRSRERWLSKDEARRLIAACESPHIRLFVSVGLMTAARTSAILEAKWEQVDFARRLLDYGEGYGNKRRAIVPLNDELLKTLLAAKEMACSDYIVDYHGRKVDNIKNGFRGARVRAGLGKDVTPHILRHTGATWMVEAGISDEEVGRMIGDTAATVRRVYGHHSPNYLKRASRALQIGLENAALEREELAP